MVWKSWGEYWQSGIKVWSMRLFRDVLYVVVAQTCIFSFFLRLSAPNCSLLCSSQTRASIPSGRNLCIWRVANFVCSLWRIDGCTCIPRASLWLGHEKGGCQLVIETQRMYNIIFLAIMLYYLILENREWRPPTCSNFTFQLLDGWQTMPWGTSNTNNDSLWSAIGCLSSCLCVTLTTHLSCSCSNLASLLHYG